MRSAKKDTITFLREAAEELRRIAQRTPEIGTALREMADNLEATAVELTRDRRRADQAKN